MKSILESYDVKELRNFIKEHNKKARKETTEKLKQIRKNINKKVVIDIKGLTKKTDKDELIKRMLKQKIHFKDIEKKLAPDDFSYLGITDAEARMLLGITEPKKDKSITVTRADGSVITLKIKDKKLTKALPPMLKKELKQKIKEVPDKGSKIDKPDSPPPVPAKPKKEQPKKKIKLVIKAKPKPKVSEAKKKETETERIIREGKEKQLKDKGKIINEVKQIKKTWTSFMEDEYGENYTLEQQKDEYDDMKRINSKLPNSIPTRIKLNEFDKPKQEVFLKLFRTNYLNYMDVENDKTGAKKEFIKQREKEKKEAEEKSKKTEKKEIKKEVEQQKKERKQKRLRIKKAKEEEKK